MRGFGPKELNFGLCKHFGYQFRTVTAAACVSPLVALMNTISIIKKCVIVSLITIIQLAEDLVVQVVPATRLN